MENDTRENKDTDRNADQEIRNETGSPTALNDKDKRQDIASETEGNMNPAPRTWTAPIILQLIFDAILVLATSTYAIFAIKQWTVMGGQLVQMQQSGQQTDQMLCLIRQQLDKMDAQISNAHALATAADQQAKTAQRQTELFARQLRVAENSLEISQRSYVTIGRKDGVVGGFIGSKNPTQNAELVIFFQNSGHVPARIAWGTSIGFVSGEKPNQASGIIYNHPFKGMDRTRDKKTGTIGNVGESVVVPADSTFMAQIGGISPKDLEDLPTKNIYPLVFGMYQFCDGLGMNSLHSFVLSYQGAPVPELSFRLNDDREFVALKPRSDATVEHLSPCEDLVPPKR